MSVDIAYITIEEALHIHQMTISHSGGGSYTLLNEGMVDSILCHIQNDDYYPEFLDKLHHLFFAFCKFHCFADGNKRIAITLSTFFLLKNGFLKESATFLREMENISYHVASGASSEELLYEILRAVLNHTYEEDDSLAFKVAQAISSF